MIELTIIAIGLAKVMPYLLEVAHKVSFEILYTLQLLSTAVHFDIQLIG